MSTLNLPRYGIFKWFYSVKYLSDSKWFYTIFQIDIASSWWSGADCSSTGCTTGLGDSVVIPKVHFSLLCLICKIFLSNIVHVGQICGDSGVGPLLSSALPVIKCQYRCGINPIYKFFYRNRFVLRVSYTCLSCFYNLNVSMFIECTSFSAHNRIPIQKPTLL